MPRPYAFSLAISKSYGKQSKAFDRSITTAPILPFCGDTFATYLLSLRGNVECCILYGNRKGIWTVFLSINLFNCLLYQLVKTGLAQEILIKSYPNLLEKLLKAKTLYPI